MPTPTCSVTSDSTCAPFQTVHATLDLAEAFILDEGLVDDAAEVRAAASVTGGEHGVGDLGHLHRLPGAPQHGLDGVGKVVLVAGAGAGVTPGAVQGAAEALDCTVNASSFRWRSVRLR